MNITVLGGKGLLGRHLTPLLEEAGHQILIASRSSDPAADLETGAGLAIAVEKADVVIHLSSNAFKPAKVDLEGTRRLLEVLTGQPLLYVSIVGVDRHPFRYYRVKHAVEKLIESSGHRHAIVRATQFHDFVAYVLSLGCKPPLAIVPKGYVFQPIDVTEVAANIRDLIQSGAEGRTPDLAGPEVLGIDHLARSYMTAAGRERPLLQVSVPGRAARAFRQGLHTNPDRAVGRKSWDEFLDGVRGKNGPPY